MGIRCSVLGHDFGDPERDRERTERGEEMIVTVREVETCRSCGETRTVSESKEVTATATAGPPNRIDESATGATGSSIDTGQPHPYADIDAHEENADPDDTQPRASGPTPTIHDESGTNPPESTIDEPATGESRTVSGASGGPTTEGPIEYDLDEDELVGGSASDPDTTESTASDTTTRDTTARDTPSTGPAATEDDRASGAGGPDGSRSTDDTERGLDRIEATESHSTPTGSRGRTHGEWPAEPGSDADPAVGASTSQHAERDRTNWDSPLGDDTDRTWSPPGESRAGDAGRVPATGATEGTLRCPACGFEEAVAASALRAGDICPECQRGYLAWETRKG